MIYLDNAATGFPKPQTVRRAVSLALSKPLGNPGRGSHPPGREAARLVFEARETIARLLGMEAPERVVFFGGATQALNTAIRGTAAALWDGARPIPVCTTVYEHNSVLRPLYDLEQAGLISLSVLTPEELLPRLRSAPPRMLVMTLLSNVTGHAFPLKAISNLCRKSGTLLIADAAQAAGSIPLEEAFAQTDLLCAPGHKGLCGIMGAGFLAIRPGCPVLPEAPFSGGSGTEPQSRFMPPLLPEHLEAGTLPVVAIAALNAGAKYVLERGVEEIAARERNAKKVLSEGLSVIPGITVYEPGSPDGPLIYNRRGMDPEAESASLEQAGICVRPGYHCAPLAHAYLATGKGGAVRLSPGPFTTKSEIEAVLRYVSHPAP